MIVEIAAGIVVAACIIRWHRQLIATAAYLAVFAALGIVLMIVYAS